VDLARLKQALRHLSPARYARALAEIKWDIARIRERQHKGMDVDAQIFTAAVMAADGRYAHPLSLTRHHAKVYSQHGEDGMLAEIFRRVGLPARPFFVEIGVENGQECNTRFLLEQGWSGVWIDGATADVEDARCIFAESVETGRLKIVHGMVTAENINAILDQSGVPDNVSFLSLDIDQNTSHVWRAMRCNTQVACVEYNASLPACLDVEVTYDPVAIWDGTNWFGASLKTLERIGTEKEMSLVGCDFSGANAFFVASERAAGKFREPFTAEAHYEIPKYTMAGPSGHPASQRARQWKSSSWPRDPN